MLVELLKEITVFTFSNTPDQLFLLYQLPSCICPLGNHRKNKSNKQQKKKKPYFPDPKSHFVLRIRATDLSNLVFAHFYLPTTSPLTYNSYQPVRMKASMCFLLQASQLDLSETAANDVSHERVPHSCAIHLFPHTQAHRHPRLANASVIDRGKGVCHSSHQTGRPVLPSWLPVT